jgi:AcrR family transcriptional regulator
VQDGFPRLGINAIAARARVDKVLICRYFGGLDARLAAYAQEASFWLSIDELIGPDLPPRCEARAAALHA